MILRLGAAAVMVAAASLAGCATGSGVVPVAPGVYALSAMRAPVRGGGPAAQQAVLEAGAVFCGQQGRHLKVLGLVPGGDPRIEEWPTAFSLTFGCG